MPRKAGRRKVKFYEIVAKKDALNPRARVYCRDRIKAFMPYELKKAAESTCYHCRYEDPVVRRVTLEVL